ncbi:MAG: LacI family DNA-binding transcriptional regulator [Bacteroidales bacterium]|jgi:LacI family transcriptional regulator|nr:LacI family DNA-binding transcriptional regulator [Bacteroidales bacterium]MBQ2549710.1 LacI family DNA-binding transcriptional regulator [Bacteroidales bacterium]
MSKNTLNTISEQTGVSVSTVSRVLSGQAEKYRISPVTAGKIREAAEQCGYIPDLVAKGLRTRRTGTVGLTIPNIDNPFFSSLSCILVSELKRLGLHVLLADSMELEKEESEALNMFISRRVDGIIAVPVGDSASELERISTRIPVVLVDRYFPESKLPFVGTDNYHGAYMAVDYLIGRGYRNILGIQGNLTAVSNRERVRGMEDAIAAHSGMRSRVDGDSFSVENGKTIMEKILSGKDRPDAVFAFSSNILLGAIMIIREAGLRIPEDIAILSFDNNGFLDYLDPAITRVEQPLPEIGRLAATLLFDLMEGKSSDEITKGTLLSPSLVIRNSC